MKQFIAFFSALACFSSVLISCSTKTAVGPSAAQATVGDEDATNAQVLNKELAAIMAIAAKAQNSSDSTLAAEFQTALRNFDARYHSDCAADYAMNRRSALAKAKNGISGNSSLGSIIGTNNYPLLSDLPLNQDGAVYVDGGDNGAPLGPVWEYMVPHTTAGGYFHGAVMELSKFDPSNLECCCMQSAAAKGAGYNTPLEWMKSPNVAVLNPAFPLDMNKLHAAQAKMDFYCDPNNKNQAYGFFKNVADVFSIVSKDDTYWWYCTKVVWRVYEDMGVDIDSDTPLIDWTNSGLYKMVKSFYKVAYFYDPAKAQFMTDQYINNAKSTLVLADEIYYSPYLSKVYEAVRQPVQ